MTFQSTCLCAALLLPVSPYPAAPVAVSARFSVTTWKCNPKRVGNIRFSAGRHLAATAATHFDKGCTTTASPAAPVPCDAR